MENRLKIELYHDNFQNFKCYNIPKAQLVIADIPYNLGNNAYASSPNGTSEGTIKMERAKRQISSFSTLMGDSEFQNICTFAAVY